MKYLASIAGFAWALLTGVPQGNAAPLKIVASIPPVHSIATNIARGTDANTVLLIEGGSDPHHLTLKPGQIQAVADADAVFWVGPVLEEGLVKALAASGTEACPAVRDEGRPAVCGLADPAAGREGAHIWLDPRGAVAMAETIKRVLTAASPENARIYQENFLEFATGMKVLEAELSKKLLPVRERALMTSHDALSPFAGRFGLKLAGFVRRTHETPVGLRRMEEVKALIEKEQVVCLTQDLEGTDRMASRLAEASGVRTAVVDMLGTGQEPGAGLYVALMHKLADDIAACLSGAG